MTGDNRRENLHDEWASAERSLRAAEVLVEAGIWPDAVGRAYYAAFHAVCALLLTEGLQGRSHRGTHHLLWEQFVRPGRLPADLHRLVTDMQTRREAADYAHPRLGGGDARQALADARRVRDVVLEYLVAEGWGDATGAGA